MAQTIPTGPYLGFTYAELEIELARYKEEVKASGTRLAGASINGQSLQFGSREGTLEEWAANLQAALAYLRPSQFQPPPTDRSAVRFPSDGYSPPFGCYR